MSIITGNKESTATDSGILTDREIETIHEDYHRTSKRWGFSAIQAIAPCDADTLPSRKDFRPVRCYDLSTGGVALVLLKKPDFEHAVVALGIAPNLTHVVVRVIHQRPAATGFIVGCRFIRKVELP